MKINISLRVLILIGWTFGILFPLVSLRRFSDSYRTAFDAVFHTDISHILMHTFLYAVLAWILASLLRKAHWSFGGMLVRVLPLIAVVAALQEAIQMICAHVVLGSDEIFDFCVDLNGGLLGLVLFTWLARRLSNFGMHAYSTD